MDLIPCGMYEEKCKSYPTITKSLSSDGKVGEKVRKPGEKEKTLLEFLECLYDSTSCPTTD